MANQVATYTLYNLALAVIILPVSYFVATRNNKTRSLLLSARAAWLLTVLLYPWDFFAIRLGVWDYPKYPGLRIYGVPLNDSFFIWLCSFFACVLLIRFDPRRSQSKGNSEGKETDGRNTRKSRP
jgi:lycopene cyclase domain-containing protein